MQIAPGFWIEGAYYLDFDTLGQLRIVGPDNHLNFGAVGLDQNILAIDSLYTQVGQLVIEGHFATNRMFLHDPAMGHIRRVRDLVERQGRTTQSFAQVYRRYPTDLAPNYIGLNFTDGAYEVTYRRLYQNHWYGVTWLFDRGVEVKRHEHKRGYWLSTTAPVINFKLTTSSDHLPLSRLANVLEPRPWPTEVFGSDQPAIKQLLDRTNIEISHLVKSNKTSGFDFGTVFPRDWMESADLGFGDLTDRAISYMYHKSYEFIDRQGSGWHENLVGEYEFLKEQEVASIKHSLDDLVEKSNRISRYIYELVDQMQDLYTSRNMIDIEPRYLFILDSLGLEALSQSDLAKAKRVARYIMTQADEHSLITFKRIPSLLRRHRNDEFQHDGNWRDSEMAYRKVHPVIAPYDVNAVFYPKALGLIGQNAEILGIDQAAVAPLRRKWAAVKELYRFTNDDGQPAFALALYNVQESGGQVDFDQLKVNHLDEAYELFYASPDKADVVSLAHRLLSPDYFYTKSGPTIVGAHDGYTTLEYHGRVIWTKQTAYAVAGLAKQLATAKRLGWPARDLDLVEQALIKTAEASIDAWIKLGAVPELHYDRAGVPHLYNDQPRAEGTMNLVQLWSAVGARRIIRMYIEAKVGRNQSTSRRGSASDSA